MDNKTIKINIYYTKYNKSNNIKYLKKIYEILELNNNFIQIGGGNEKEKLDFVIKNIDLIKINVELFNNLYNQVIINDEIIKNFNSDYKGYNSSEENLNEYLEKINNDINIFLKN